MIGRKEGDWDRKEEGDCRRSGEMGASHCRKEEKRWVQRMEEDVLTMNHLAFAFVMVFK